MCGDGDYEGISTDVVALLSQQLGIEISVLNLTDRTIALAEDYRSHKDVQNLFPQAQGQAVISQIRSEHPGIRLVTPAA